MDSPKRHRIALVVVSHPDSASFNQALAHVAATTLHARGFSTHLCNLYADGFDPVLTKDEFHGLRTKDDLTKRYIALLASAEVLVVVHPNCWAAPPAMMKGWMDRVFAQGAAYEFEKRSDQGDVPRGLLQIKTAIVFNTSNTSEERERAAFGDPLERIWRDCLLQYYGVETTVRKGFRIVATSSPSERQTWLSEIQQIIDDAVR